MWAQWYFTQIAENKIVIAGAIADPVDGGLLIFANSTKDEVLCLFMLFERTITTFRRDMTKTDPCPAALMSVECR